MRLPGHGPLRRFCAARLSPQGAFGLHLSVGLLLLALTAALFAVIARDVMAAGAITVLDLRVAHWFHAQAHAREALTRAVLLWTHLHSGVGVAVLATLLGLYFYARRASYWLLTLLIAIPGGMFLNLLLKYSFLRLRPRFDQPILSLETYSFPSGHMASATLLYGLLAAYLLCRTPQWHRRLAIAAAALLLAGLVGLSRIYLGVHYLSDVLAAFAESCGWLAVCISACSSLRRRRGANLRK